MSIIEAGDQRLVTPRQNSGSFPKKIWRRFIANELNNFEGDASTAAHLMTQFQAGRDFIYNKFRRSRYRLVKPPILILEAGERNDVTCMYTNRPHSVVVSQSYLQFLSQMDPTSRMFAFINNGQIVFDGTTPHHLFLAGVEEGHHSIYHQLVNDPESHSPTGMSAAEYDSLTVEFKALLWQLRAAKQKDFPSETIAVLTQRVGAARKYRATHPHFHVLQQFYKANISL